MPIKIASLLVEQVPLNKVEYNKLHVITSAPNSKASVGCLFLYNSTDFGVVFGSGEFSVVSYEDAKDWTFAPTNSTVTIT